MTDLATRLKTVTSDATEMSPYSDLYYRSYYDTSMSVDMVYNPDAKPFVFLHKQPTENGPTFTKIMLNANHDDAALTRHMHHALTHIHQNASLEKNGIAKMSLNYPIADYAFLGLLKDVQATTMEQEGPLQGFFQNMQQGDFSKIDMYKNYVAQDAKAFATYSAALLKDDALLTMPVEQAVDHVGYLYLNDFSRKPEAEQKQSIKAARQSMAQHLLNDPQLVTASMDDALDAYQKFRNSDQGKREAFMKRALAFTEIPDALVKKPGLSLQEISKSLTVKDDEPFLTAEEWQGVLPQPETEDEVRIRDKGNEFVMKKIMGRSAYQDEYDNLSTVRKLELRDKEKQNHEYGRADVRHLMMIQIQEMNRATQRRKDEKDLDYTRMHRSRDRGFDMDR